MSSSTSGEFSPPRSSVPSVHKYKRIPPPLHPLLFPKSPELLKLNILNNDKDNNSLNWDNPASSFPQSIPKFDLESKIASVDEQIQLSNRRMTRSNSVSRMYTGDDNASEGKFDYSHLRNETLSVSELESDSESIMGFYPESYDGLSSTRSTDGDDQAANIERDEESNRNHEMDRKSSGLANQNDNEKTCQNFIENAKVDGETLSGDEFHEDDQHVIDLTMELEMELDSEGIDDVHNSKHSLLEPHPWKESEASQQLQVARKWIIEKHVNEMAVSDIQSSKTKSLTILPNEVLWKIYSYLDGLYIAKLSILSKSHYYAIFYPNFYPIQPEAKGHAFWTYLSQLHFKHQLIRRYKFPCEVHPKLFYLVQWSKYVERLINAINRACSSIELRTKLHHRDEVTDVCLFSPYLFWLYRQTYKYELYFNHRDMRQHPLHFYYQSLPGGNNSKKYYDRHEDYMQYYNSSMTLIATPKMKSDNTPIKPIEDMRLKRHMRGILRNWYNQWLNESAHNYPDSIVSMMKQFSKKKIRVKLLEERDLSEYKKTNGKLDRMKIYVNYSTELSR